MQGSGTSGRTGLSWRSLVLLLSSQTAQSEVSSLKNLLILSGLTTPRNLKRSKYFELGRLFRDRQDINVYLHRMFVTESANQLSSYSFLNSILRRSYIIWIEFRTSKLFSWVSAEWWSFSSTVRISLFNPCGSPVFKPCGNFSNIS